MINLRTSRGVNLSARLLHFTRSSAVIEVHDVSALVSVSEVVEGFQIPVGDGARYDGRAVVRNCVNTGLGTVCEMALDESSWEMSPAARHPLVGTDVNDQFKGFLADYDGFRTVLPEYKLVIAEMQGFFSSLKTWFDRVEMNLDQLDPDGVAEQEDELVNALENSVLPCIDALFEEFESVANRLSPEQHPAHRRYMRQLLHPLVLCAPFAHQTFHKPLGYAGDYQMVNLIFSRCPQGNSLYSKMINAWFVRQPPARAHRNRIDYLVELLSASAMRAAREGRTPSFMSLGCGPAVEVQRFMSADQAMPRANFVLVDFNQQTLDYVREMINKVSRRGRTAGVVTYECKSVTQVLKESVAARSGRQAHRQHDVVYCAGLFDYLTNAACQQLSEALYQMVAPGGLLVLTNVNVVNPLKHGMDHLLDWILIYRTVPDMMQLVPRSASADSARALVDATGVNVFLEVTKPAHE